ncbi:MAG: hypothetical protein AMQ22_00061 [Candidatus Methanofastidiosum methylothiophilum]|uniref:Uncharacterized protein n=1 Tax=Candidatus Methanofastidiosum methylothiophilum TaxID=1705564 RepID=A0A150J9D7_9EURY|nr:MAG: hypothetical protein AMQ22_00061 [Candidatus Methanofastidiosum methylthiophilus]
MGVIFSDDFSGSGLDPEKWDTIAVGNTIYSVGSSKLSITSCDPNTWFGENVTQHGNQIRPIIDLPELEGLPDDYIITFNIRCVNNVSSSLGINQVALVRDNGDLVVGIGYMDYEGGVNQSRRYCKAENSFSYKTPSWDQSISDDQIIKPVDSDDSMEITIEKSGSTITLSDENGVVGTVDITNTPSAIAIITGRYPNYSFYGTTEISNFSVTSSYTPLQVKRVRAKVGIMEGIIKRVRANVWVMPDRRVFVRSKVGILEQAKKVVRAKVNIIDDKPPTRLVKKFVRAKVDVEELQRVFVRAKVNVDNDETSIELFAQVVIRAEEYDEGSEGFEFIVGDKRYDS